MDDGLSLPGNSGPQLATASDKLTGHCSQVHITAAFLFDQVLRGQESWALRNIAGRSVKRDNLGADRRHFIRRDVTASQVRLASPAVLDQIAISALDEFRHDQSHVFRDVLDHIKPS